jgi:hypothetical protein
MIEYKNLITQYPPSEEQLTQLGADGWDMCGVNGNTYHFKRAKSSVLEQYDMMLGVPPKPKNAAKGSK